MVSTNSTQGVTREILAAFAACPVATISDNLDRSVGARGLRMMSRSQRMVGTAFTVKTAPGDNAWIHRALDVISPGDILVVDGGGYEDRALIGEIMMRIAQARGAAGWVIDGAIRDLDVIAPGNFPVFARSTTHLGPYKNGPGALQVSVSIGGMVVHPGDVVVGDIDGVVAFRPETAADLLAAAEKQIAKEETILRQIADGTYRNQYA
jgi:regulator of RNase E activity RraA